MFFSIHKKTLNIYQKRNFFLKQLGYKNYQEYLQSTLWKKVRDKALKIKGNLCEICGSTNHINVHHMHYSLHTLTGKKIGSLFILCENCHRKIHTDCNNNPDLIQKITMKRINSIKGI